MSHADFAHCGKIFATLDCPTVGWAMFKLSPEQHRDFVKSACDTMLAKRGPS